MAGNAEPVIQRTARPGVAAAGALLAAALVACGSAQDAVPVTDPGPVSARVATRVPLSGPSPFAPEGCGQPETPIYALLPEEIDGANNDGNEFGDESDVSIAVNPQDPDHIVAAWVQDAALGILVAVTFDGGGQWQRVVVPTLTYCQESEEERSLHARLSFGPGGRVYLAIEAVDGFFPDPRQIPSIRIPVSASADGGLSWTTAFFDTGPADNPKGFSTLATEPDVANAVLVAWHATEPTLGIGGSYLSRSTDGGQTWVRTTARNGGVDELPSNRVLALRDGTLLMFGADSSVRGFFAGGSAVGGLRVQRSTDKGQTWSAPLTLAAGAVAQWPSAAQAPDGAVYVGWSQPADDGDPVQMVARSDDAGQTWNAPVAAARTDPDRIGEHASLAVAGNGVVGFAYTDQRNDVPGDSAVQRDVWLSYSRNRGLSWEELHLAGPFEMAAGDLGFYHETAPLPDGFAAAFPAGAPLALDGRTDVIFVRVRTD